MTDHDMVSVSAREAHNLWVRRGGGMQLLNKTTPFYASYTKQCIDGDSRRKALSPHNASSETSPSTLVITELHMLLV